MKLDIARAWKDEAYRQSLSSEELAQLPENPAGELELNEAELEAVYGGGRRDDGGGRQDWEEGRRWEGRHRWGRGGRRYWDDQNQPGSFYCYNSNNCYNSNVCTNIGNVGLNIGVVCIA